jgi:hypothetical protein
LTQVPQQAGAIRKEAGDSQAADPYETYPDTNPSALQQLEFHQKITAIEQALADDQEALQILEGWKDRMTAPEIRDLWGFNQKQYDTIVRRLRRKLAASGITEGLSTGDKHVN